jgi:CheY-like chemotaxis protein
MAPATSEEDERKCEPIRGPILIIDSDREVRVYLCRRLEERGYEVEAVHNARVAFDKLRGGLEPCLVLFDLRLLYEGLKLEHRFDLGNRSLGSVPVVAYTADDELRKRLRAGSSPRTTTALDRLCELAARHCPLPADSRSLPAPTPTIRESPRRGAPHSRFAGNEWQVEKVISNR